MKTIVKSVLGRFVNCIALVSFFFFSSPPLARAAVYGPPTYCMGYKDFTPSNSQNVGVICNIDLSYPNKWLTQITLNFPFFAPCSWVHVKKWWEVDGQRQYYQDEVYTNVCANIFGLTGPVCGNPFQSYGVEVAVINTRLLSTGPVYYHSVVSTTEVTPPPDN